ncbi:MAG: hypothetical protein KQH57_17280 [Actinomycetales bacterium]|nr:hypothetical protein [Actinomycetales bacterium]
MDHYVFGTRARYVVTAKCVVAVGATGGQEHVYRGQPLPTGTRRGQIEHLLTLGLIKEAPDDDA